MWLGCAIDDDVTSLPPIVTDPEVIDYLENAGSEIKTSGDAQLFFPGLTPALSDYDVFFSGEAHTVSANKSLEFALLKYLHAQKGIKHYVIEYQHSFAQRLNQFLASGDTVILNNLFQPLQGTAGWTKEAYQHWLNLYEWNSTLDVDEQITVIGLDIAHQRRTALDYAQSLIPNTSIPQDIVGFLGQFNELDPANFVDANLEQITRKLSDEMASNGQPFEDFLSANSDEFIFVVNNLLQYYETQRVNVEAFSFTRENFIFNNFEVLNPVYLQGNPFYGQWGYFHTFQRTVQNVQWLASRLDQNFDSPYQNRVASIVYLYDQSQALSIPSYQVFHYTNMSTPDIFPMQAWPFTLYDLSNMPSPFNDKLTWLLNQPGSPSIDVTTDYFQYVIHIRQSPASSPFGS